MSHSKNWPAQDIKEKFEYLALKLDRARNALLEKPAVVNRVGLSTAPPRSMLPAIEPNDDQIEQTEYFTIVRTPQTAPAAVCIPNTGEWPMNYIASDLAPATRKQNQRLVSLLALMNGSSRNNHNHPNKKNMNDDGEIILEDASNGVTTFERNLNEIHRLLGDFDFPREYLNYHAKINVLSDCKEYERRPLSGRFRK